MSFDDYAMNWDTEERIERAKIIAREISKSIDTNEGLTAMEFGCGTGLIGFNIFNRFKTITLLDSSERMIDVLKSKMAEYKVDNMIPLHLDITGEEQLNMRFDVIYNSMVLHHIHDIEGVARAFYDMLNDEGYLCIVDLNEEDGSFHKSYDDFDGHNGFNQENLKNILYSSGFKDVESHTFYHGIKKFEGQEISYSLFIMKARKR